jgi:hypothetical protein
VGGALLRRQDRSDPRLTGWNAHRCKSYREVEEAVSRELRSRFSFVWVHVPTKELRLELEGGLIGLLAQHPIGAPSPGWLGRFASDSAITSSGLWNTQHLKSPWTVP